MPIRPYLLVPAAQPEGIVLQEVPRVAGQGIGTRGGPK